MKWLSIVIGCMFLTNQSFADPCGMVPPLAVADAVKDSIIARTGIQRTYVMFKDGIETMVLHPEFKGKIDDFGMLIPFPTPPQIRIVEDNIFAHLEAAINPPTIHLNHYNEAFGIGGLGGLGATGAGRGGSGSGLGRGPLGSQDVRVREEAVGMYQVAVIEAGSAAALKKWMKEHQYRFPTGMEEVAQEYVEEKWCFVAIKTQIGQKPKISAKAGMRDVDTSLGQDVSYNGYVQGMGFRFSTKDPVIPMRLSVFNGKDPQNVIYMLAETPMQANNLPVKFIDIHIPGEKLYQHLTEPLTVVFDNDLMQKRTTEQQEQIEAKRNPDPYLKEARTLIGSDLAAIQNKTLNLESEDLEKELLAISESFSLRGPDINALHQDFLANMQEQQIDTSLELVKDMTLTVFSGVFPNQVIQNENLYFSSTSFQEKASSRNDPLSPSHIVGKAYGTMAFTFQGDLPKGTATLNLVTSTPTRPTIRSKADIETLKIEGSIEESLIRRVLRRNAGQIRYCYQRVQKDDPKLGGQATFQVVIAQDGNVSDATTTSSPANFSKVSRCIESRFRRFRFPSPTDQKAARFKVSYRFSPQ